MYRRFDGKREFIRYLQGARFLFKFRSGTHGLLEELGRHNDRDGRVECMLCGAECESVQFTCCGSVLHRALVGIFVRKRSNKC